MLPPRMVSSAKLLNKDSVACSRAYSLLVSGRCHRSDDIAIEGHTARTCSGVEEIGCMRISPLDCSQTSASGRHRCNRRVGISLDLRPESAKASHSRQSAVRCSQS